MRIIISLVALLFRQKLYCRSIKQLFKKFLRKIALMKKQNGRRQSQNERRAVLMMSLVAAIFLRYFGLIKEIKEKKRKKIRLLFLTLADLLVHYYNFIIDLEKNLFDENFKTLKYYGNKRYLGDELFQTTHGERYLV